MEKMLEPLLLTVTEAAHLLGISRSLAYELAAAGELPTIRIRGSIRVSARDLRVWVEKKLEQESGGGER
jgi:excisionase family DNA binding protein